MKMPFGKHEGTNISELPRPYLEWLHYKTVGKSPELTKAIAKALARKQSKRKRNTIA